MDPFLDIVFIELKNSEFNNLYFLELQKEGEISKNIIIIQNPIKKKIFSVKGEIKKRWGFDLQFTTIKNFDCYCLPLISSNQKVVGIHKKNKNDKNKYNIAINSQEAIKAIKIMYECYITDKSAFIEKENIFIQKEVKLLTDIEIDELEEGGLKETNSPNIFISPASIFVTPLWFYRSNHAWYWTPNKPVNDDESIPNWIIIYPGCSLKVIGGTWDGVEPAERNIKLIHWLEATSFKYLV